MHALRSVHTWAALIAVGIGATALTAVEGEEVALLQPAILDRSGFRAEARLHIPQRTLTRGEKLTVECELHGTSGAEHIYNGFLSSHYMLPAQIVVVSSDGKIRRELLRQDDDRETHKSEAWVFLRSDESVGREFAFILGEEDFSRSGEVHALDLPPGEYSIQAIYSNWIVAMNPNAIFPKPDEDLGGGRKDEPLPIAGYSPAKMDQPAAVSKVVTFRIR
jgi:hypothetical protein